ncbi:hypothetical protein KI387_029887, partial [Taxus chinensis]
TLDLSPAPPTPFGMGDSTNPFESAVACSVKDEEQIPISKTGEEEGNSETSVESRKEEVEVHVAVAAELPETPASAPDVSLTVNGNRNNITEANGAAEDKETTGNAAKPSLHITSIGGFITEELAPFDPSKKKKKKKKVLLQDTVDEGAEKVTEKIESLSVTDTFSGLKKKKKKHVEGSFQDDENVETVEDDNGKHEGESEEIEEIDSPDRYPWEGTDRDYKYEELLGRVFNILRENNPELAGDRRRTVMRPPQVLREGTKKTVFVNFMDLCKTMHRQPEHVMTFLLAEMGTSGSLDGQQRLVIKGRFAPKNFEGILRRYINEYVICNGCKSPDTILSKENRLFFLRCEQGNSRVHPKPDMDQNVNLAPLSLCVTNKKQAPKSSRGTQIPNRAVVEESVKRAHDHKTQKQGRKGRPLQPLDLKLSNKLSNPIQNGGQKARKKMQDREATNKMSSAAYRPANLDQNPHGPDRTGPANPQTTKLCETDTHKAPSKASSLPSFKQEPNPRDSIVTTLIQQRRASPDQQSKPSPNQTAAHPSSVDVHVLWHPSRLVLLLVLHDVKLAHKAEVWMDAVNYIHELDMQYFKHANTKIYEALSFGVSLDDDIFLVNNVKVLIREATNNHASEGSNWSDINRNYFKSAKVIFLQSILTEIHNSNVQGLE